MVWIKTYFSFRLQNLSTISLAILGTLEVNPANIRNPHNRLLSCGGSSGGEGSLIGARGSVLGVGTDIGTHLISSLTTGGSIRIPAAFQGLFGLRPSHGRMPYARAVNSVASLIISNDRWKAKKLPPPHADPSHTVLMISSYLSSLFSCKNHGSGIPRLLNLIGARVPSRKFAELKSYVLGS